MIPLALYLAIVAIMPPLRATFSRWRFGRITPFVTCAAAIIALGTVITLVVFHHVERPDVSGYRTMLPVQWFGGVIGTAILFPLLNAAFEEIAFRGVLFDSVASLWGNAVAVVVSATFFGYGHTQGYPSGPTGVALAGVFGLVIGWLRAFTGGIGLPYLVHVVADTTIFILLTRSSVW
ncbi:MAG: CPBP family intramembrane glutamic endopeptidase [Chthoniobacteraceae bacterium]